MNNLNYDVLFEERKKTGDGKKLLLHACCAPCSTYCLTQVLDVYDVTLYYANDNITDVEEWKKRFAEVEKLVKLVNDGKFEQAPKYPLKLVVQNFDSRRFYNAALGFEQEREGGARCEKCFNLRLNDTKTYAERHQFDIIGTTLTVSPYKNSQLLNQIGESLQTENLLWLASDFKKRDGYNQSVALSQKYNLYRQHYCGCEFSKQQKSDLK